MAAKILAVCGFLRGSITVNLFKAQEIISGQPWNSAHTASDHMSVYKKRGGGLPLKTQQIFAGQKKEADVGKDSVSVQECHVWWNKTCTRYQGPSMCSCVSSPQICCGSIIMPCVDIKSELMSGSQSGCKMYHLVTCVNIYQININEWITVWLWDGAGTQFQEAFKNW
eukprot:1161863-Pelagomonas_calceolata.AAC.7